MRLLPTPDGIEIAVHEHGGRGRPTLLCHATGFHGAVWEPLSAALGDACERWALDFRAHGASVVPPGAPLDWERMGADVLTVIDGLGLPRGRVLGVGHSMGGACLLLAEQARPGTFAGLWLFEPIVPPPLAGAPTAARSSLADAASRRRPSFPSFADALANYAGKPPLNALRADALHAYVRHGFVTGDDGDVHLACRPEDEARVFDGGASHGAWSRLGEVICPTVIACGEDLGFPAALAPEIAAALPHGRLEQHRHMGHFGPLEAPSMLATSILELAATLR